MKRIISMITAIIIASSTCCLLCACMRYTSISSYDDADKYSAGSQTYENTDLDELRIDWPKGQIVLVEDPNATCVTVTEDNTLDDKKKVHSYYHDGILNIEFWQSGLRSYVTEKDKHLTVTYRSVRNLAVNTASSIIKANALQAVNVDFKMTSGDIDVDRITCERLTCKMTSGDLDVDRITCDSLMCEMTSGDIDINKVDCNTFRLDMTSGDAQFDEITATRVSMSQSSGNITARALNVDTFQSDSTSGDLDASFIRADRIDIASTSGNAEIGIPADGATVAMASSSGSFKSDLTYSVDQGRYVFGAGACEIGIETTSGSVRIK